MIQPLAHTAPTRCVVNPSELFSPALPPPLRTVMGAAVGKALALDHINRIYRSAATSDASVHFLDRVLDSMKVQPQVAESDLARIPRTGPVVVVANHPFGGIEGIVLGALLRRVRPDMKIMANYLLRSVPDLHDSMIFVDPFGRQTSAQANLKPIKECLRWLKQGSVLGVFPSGTVSHLHLRKGQVTDPAWSPTIARLVRASGACVVPVYFQGTNSLMFHLLGLLHPRLRTGMLARELAGKQNRPLSLRIGNPIPFQRLEGIADDQAMMDYLRRRTYNLGRSMATLRRRPPLFRRAPRRTASVGEPVAEAQSVDRLQEEVDRLPAPQKLISQGDCEVYHASARQIPSILLEIGRLREITFRQVKEGTGCARDLDAFDQHYQHLFIWNREKRELVGAYRLGQTDLILRSHGPRGLYTTTLFAYRRKLLEKIGPALELGRSFVRIEYQKSFLPLLLLWKGVARYVARHPSYRYLFGPVSVSNEYQALSRHLMVAFLKKQHFLPDWARWVRPRRPLRADPLTALKVRQAQPVLVDLQEVDALIADIEPDLKGLPVLLRQYIRLGGKLLAFNVDQAFSDVLDGLILVDLAETDPTLLSKYMGAEECARFRAFHQVN